MLDKNYETKNFSDLNDRIDEFLEYLNSLDENTKSYFEMEFTEDSDKDDDYCEYYTISRSLIIVLNDIKNWNANYKQIEELEYIYKYFSQDYPEWYEASNEDIYDLIKLLWVSEKEFIRQKQEFDKIFNFIESIITYFKKDYKYFSESFNISNKKVKEEIKRRKILAEFILFEKEAEKEVQKNEYKEYFYDIVVEKIEILKNMIEGESSATLITYDELEFELKNLKEVTKELIKYGLKNEAKIAIRIRNYFNEEKIQELKLLAWIKDIKFLLINPELTNKLYIKKSYEKLKEEMKKTENTEIIEKFNKISRLKKFN